VRETLLATGDRLLVEAALRYRIWGIGYTSKHDISYRQHWEGNRLGKALMEAREYLRQGDEKRYDNVLMERGSLSERFKIGPVWFRIR
jgi:hypothetical protein